MTRILKAYILKYRSDSICTRTVCSVLHFAEINQRIQEKWLIDCIRIYVLCIGGGAGRMCCIYMSVCPEYSMMEREYLAA
jgi:hypothetical protein